MKSVVKNKRSQFNVAIAKDNLVIQEHRPRARDHSWGFHFMKFHLCRWISIALIVSAFHPPAGAQELVLSNNFVERVLTFDGHIWRTTLFARADGSEALPVQSDGFKILLFDNRELTLDQYQADGAPVWVSTNGVQQLSIHYVLRAPMTNVPTGVTITYTLGDSPYLRKVVRLKMSQGESVDRLEVERFSANEPETRGGRGEPVFVGTNWFFGMEYPAFYSRRTDGNTPVAGTGPYDHFGNYSYIDLDGRDIDDNPRPGSSD